MTDWTGNGKPSERTPAASETALQRAQRKLGLWRDAEDAVGESAQEYWIGRQRLRRADLPQIHKMVLYYESQVRRLQRGRGPGARIVRVVPRDD